MLVWCTVPSVIRLYTVPSFLEVKSVNKEKPKGVKHEYKVKDQVLLDRGILQRKLSPKRDGPYQIVRVYSNGTLKIQKGIYVQCVSLRRCVPYVAAPLEEANAMR